MIRFILVEIKSILYAHARVNSEDARVRFIGFGASSLRIEISSYIMVSTLDTSIEVKRRFAIKNYGYCR